MVSWWEISYENRPMLFKMVWTIIEKLKKFYLNYKGKFSLCMPAIFTNPIEQSFYEDRKYFLPLSLLFFQIMDMNGYWISISFKYWN